MTRVDRREFLGALTTLMGGATLFGSASHANTRQNQLNIYSWADYLHPDTIPNFEKEFGMRVVYDTFSSNEGLLAKLQAGASNYDIVVPTNYMVRHLRAMNVLSKLDHERIPNLKNLMAHFTNSSFDPNMGHSVPYTWGTTGIGFNASLFRSEKEWPVSWDCFWDKKFKGRVTLLDDARETVGMALKRNGGSYNTTDVATIKAAAHDLQSQKPNVMCYTSDQVIVQLSASDSWLALSYSGDVCQAGRDNKDVQYKLPDAGASIWFDNFCIPNGAPHPLNGYRWINYMLRPDVAAANANYTRYATPNEAAMHLIDDALKSNRNLYPSPRTMARCEELGEVGAAIFVYDRVWTELKCL